MNTDKLLDYIKKNNAGSGSDGQLIAAALLTHAEVTGLTHDESVIAETFGKWLSAVRRLPT